MFEIPGYDSFKLATPPRLDDELETWCFECDHPLPGPGEPCECCQPPDDDDRADDDDPEDTPIVTDDDPDAADIPEPDRELGGES